ATGAAEDLRVDADHLAGHVEQRRAGVAGIHGHVGLDEGHVVVLSRHRARGGADDARGGAVLEAEGRADREHPLPRLDARRIAELDDRQIGRVDLDHRHVGPLVRADDLGGKLAPVGEAHGHLIGVGHYVGVGEDVAVGIDEETRARAARRRYIAARPFPRSASSAVPACTAGEGGAAPGAGAGSAPAASAEAPAAAAWVDWALRSREHAPSAIAITHRAVARRSGVRLGSNLGFMGTLPATKSGNRRLHPVRARRPLSFRTHSPYASASAARLTMSQFPTWA